MSYATRRRGMFATAGLGGRGHYGRDYQGLFGLGSLLGLGQAKSSGGGGTDQGLQVAGQALQVGVPLITSIIGAATGQPTATPSATTATPAIDPSTAMAPPVSASPSWYWPVMIGVGVAVLGGIGYMSYNVKKPVNANRRRVHRNSRRRRGRRVSRNARLSEARRARLSKSAFVFPARRAWPIESPKAAYDAIRAMQIGRVGSPSDYLAISNFIQRRYPGVWAKYGHKLSWSKTKAAKTKARASRARHRRTSRKAA